jgi:mature parasite-infected erythrocyte surface antigen
VLEKKGIYTKVAPEKKQIFFSKENNFAGDNKKVVSLYKIAGILDSQFKNAKEKNFFDYDLSIKILLDKELELSKRKELEKEYNFSNIKEKKDPVKELELKLNKELVKKGIEDYKNNIDKQIQDYFKIIEFGKTEREKEHFNTRYKEVNGYFSNKVKDFMLEEITKNIKEDSLNKATATYLKNTFKNLAEDCTVEKLQNSKLVKNNANIEILKDQFYKKVPSTMEIEKASIEELKKMQKDISKNVEKSQEEIKEFFEELPAFKKKKELENNINNMLGSWDKNSSLGTALDNIYTYMKKEFIEYTKDKNLEDKELNQYRLDLEKTRETWYWDSSSEEEEREEEKEEVKKKEEEKVVTVKTKPRKSVLEEALEATIKEKEKLLKEQQEKDKEELEKSTNKVEDIKKEKGYDYEH